MSCINMERILLFGIIKLTLKYEQKQHSIYLLYLKWNYKMETTNAINAES